MRSGRVQRKAEARSATVRFLWRLLLRVCAGEIHCDTNIIVVIRLGIRAVVDATEDARAIASVLEYCQIVFAVLISFLVCRYCLSFSRAV